MNIDEIRKEMTREEFVEELLESTNYGCGFKGALTGMTCPKNM
jgi:hypothetical protein